jgi:hypothetical protein
MDFSKRKNAIVGSMHTVRKTALRQIKGLEIAGRLDACAGGCGSGLWRKDKKKKARPALTS